MGFRTHEFQYRREAEKSRMIVKRKISMIVM